jgi:serine/threonine-protein kinase
MVARSINAASGLAPVALCADVSVLRAVVPPPTNPEARAKVEALRQRLSVVRALQAAGRFPEGTKLVVGLLRDVRAENYEPLLAETLQVAGEVEMWTRPVDEAAAIFEEALLRAEASRHDRVLAEVAVDEASALAVWDRLDELDRFVPRARATLTRIGGDLRLESWLDTAISIGMAKRARYNDSLAMLDETLTLKRRVLGEHHWDVALTLGNMADKLHLLGRDREALAKNDEAIAELERALGSRHPDLALHVSNRGEIHLALGQPALAREDFQRAFAIWSEALPPDHLYLSYALTGLGRATLDEGVAVADAIAPLERALTIRSAPNVSPQLRAEAAFALARALWLTGRDRPRALGLATQAHELIGEDRARERREVEVTLARWRSEAPEDDTAPMAAHPVHRGARR